MNDITHDLFRLMERHCSDRADTLDYRQAFCILSMELEQLETMLNAEQYDKLSRALMAYIAQEEHAAFRLGLRLGLQLHAL